MVQIRLLRQELDGVMELLRVGHATRIRALALERDVARLEGELSEHAANVAGLEQQIRANSAPSIQLPRRSPRQARDAVAQQAAM